MKKFRITILAVFLLSLLVSTYGMAMVTDRELTTGGRLSGSSFTFNNISEYDGETLEVLNENTNYKVSLQMNERVRGNESNKKEVYKVNIELTDPTNEVIHFKDALMEIENDYHQLQNNNGFASAGTVTAYNKEEGKRVTVNIDWLSKNLKVVTGSAILKDTNTSMISFLTLGELTQEIKKLPKEDKFVPETNGNVEPLEAVLITDDSYDKNNVRVSLNRSSKNIIRGENAILFFAAAPKSVASSCYGCPAPRMDWTELSLHSKGSNAVVTKPFANRTKPSVGTSVTVSFSYAGIGGAYSWNVQSPTPSWYTGTVGSWNFNPDISASRAVSYGIPVEGYIYGDQAGTAYVEAWTDISWTEYKYSSTSILGYSAVSKNNTEMNGSRASFSVINP